MRSVGYPSSQQHEPASNDQEAALTSLQFSERPSYRTLQQWFDADTRAHEAQEDHLRQLQLTPPGRVTTSDRRKLNDWDYSVLNTCKAHIEVLLSISIRTWEEDRVLRAMLKLAGSLDALVHDAIELAEKLDKKLGPLDGDLDEEESRSVVAPPPTHENSAHDRDSRASESPPAVRRLGQDHEKAAAHVVVAVREAALAENSEREGRASSVSSDTDGEEDAIRRWEACVGRGPSAPVLRLGRR